MRLSHVFIGLGADAFEQLIRGISLGKLKTYQLFEMLKISARLNKLNTETLRKATPRLLARLTQGDEDLAKELGQAVLVSHLEMISTVLDFLGIPNDGGFFAKDIEPAKRLTGEWAERALDHFKTVYPEPLLRFYLQHLAFELNLPLPLSEQHAGNQT